MPPGYSPPPKKVSHADLEEHRAAKTRKAVLAGIGAAAFLTLGSVGVVQLVRRWPVAKPPVLHPEVESPVTPVIPPRDPSPLPTPGVLGDPVASEQRTEYVCVTLEPADEPKEEKARAEKPRLEPTEPVYRVDAFQRPLVPPDKAVLETPDPRSLFADMPIGVLCGQGQDPRQGFTLEIPVEGCIPETGPKLKPLGSCGEAYLFLFTNGYKDRSLIGALSDDEGQMWDIQLPPNSTTFLKSRWSMKRAYLRVSSRP
ncbi:MAG: hypothetical protein WC728_16115 [Elusimicrobiota bacterium]